jgi:hypothetical protein
MTTHRKDVKIFEILNLIEAKLEAKFVRDESEEAAVENVEETLVLCCI